MSDYRTELKQHFEYLADKFGFSLVSFSDEPRAFDNFVAIYERDDLALRITRDRSQMFISLALADSDWQDKEEILEQVGIEKTRFPTVNGLWAGYEIVNQAHDLEEHLETIVQFLRQ
jgi:hypothetical protein